MPVVELTTADVATYTKGRLPSGDPPDSPDPATLQLLNSALGALRRYCGWRVTPVGVDTVTVDGPGRPVLSLPTLHVVELQSVIEDGNELDLSSLHWSPVGLIRKKSGACWSRHYGGITVRMNHGYDNAYDWQSAVLELVDRMEAGVGRVIGSSGPLIERKVDDVTDRWMNSIGDPGNSGLFGLINRTLVDPYRIEPSA